MNTTNETLALAKAEAVLDTLDEFENKLNPTFQEFLDTVLNKWRELNYSQKEVGKVNVFPEQEPNQLSVFSLDQIGFDANG
jgi:hypothetical protein